jgi:pimeloyl-ACP methyl ester carboxylesterase
MLNADSPVSRICSLASSMPQPPSPDAEDWRQLYPFASHWADLPGGRMHYLDEGPPVSDSSDGPTLLFIHGNPTWSFHWRRLIAALRSRHRCIAPDHIGCGFSDKPARLLSLDEHIETLCALVRQLNLERITLVAQDWGGAIGLGALQRMSERLESIVLFNTGAFPPRYIPWRIRVCRIPVLGRIAVQGANLFSLAALRMTLARRKTLEPTIAAGYLAPYDNWSNRRGVYGFVHDIPGGPSHPTWQTLAAIERGLAMFVDRPIALIWGMRDWCFRPDCLERFLEAWPNAEAHRLADVGHWVVEDAPDEAQRIVEEFVARNDLANCGLPRVSQRG